MQTFKVVESYLHRAAKQVVVEWLREAAKEAGEGLEWFKLHPVSCRPNRGAPFYGIHPEWPILKGQCPTGIDFVWDEVTDDADGKAPPSAADLIANGKKLACVVDIGIHHKGRLGCAVEIVHKHPAPQWKRDFFAARDVQLVEVDALAVLRKIERPAQLPLWFSPNVRRVERPTPKDYTAGLPKSIPGDLKRMAEKLWGKGAPE